MWITDNPFAKSTRSASHNTHDDYYNNNNNNNNNNYPTSH
jgi:hypothetical protein